MSTTTTIYLTPSIAAVIAEGAERTSALGRLTRQRRLHLHDAECPRDVATVPEWIAQQGDPALRHLWSRLGGLVGVADQGAVALTEAQTLAASLHATLADLTRPADEPAPDYRAVRAREQAVVDAGAVREALAALTTAIGEAEAVTLLHVGYVKDAVVAALVTDRELKQRRIVTIMGAARQQIAAVLAAQHEHEPLRQWAAGHGGVLALVPLTEP